MIWTFYIDELEIEEPIGFSDLVIRVKRDSVWHGVFFEATTSELQFYGAASDYLQAKKTGEGFSADVTFKAYTDCGGEDEDLFHGKLDFRQYKEKCGNDGCLVIMPVEQTGCIMTLRNRYDQKVDLSEQLAFNKTTILQDYDGLNFEMELAAQELEVSNRAETGIDDITTNIKDDPNFTPNNFDDFNGYISPAYDNIIKSSFGVFGTSSTIIITEDGANNIPPYPDFPTNIGTAILLRDIKCELSNVLCTFRHKGVINIQQSGVGAQQTLRLKLFRLPAGLDGTVFSNWVEEFTDTFYQLNFDGDVLFDISEIIPLSLSEGDFIYYGVNLLANDLSQITSFNYTQSKESFFELKAASICPPTDATVSLIHETASRVTEAITDMCLKVKSDYYGRTDSQPYAAAEDGCGSLRVLTNGLRLRIAENPVHFLSLKEIFDSLNAIDNIGMGIEGDNLRIEPVEYFYQDVEIIKHLSIPKSDFSLDAEDAYSIIKVGYKKWETESLNGLDEFNSNKEFRTSLKSINKTLDVTSGFVAGGYPIENTRQQSFADTGAADTKYDNETFIICVTRTVYSYEVEQGNIVDPSGFYSPATAYNWRIRPMYNLMRWWKSIAQSYNNLINSASKLFFTSGTGNLTASGILSPYDSCGVDAKNKAENSDLTRLDMLTGEDPIWKPEIVNYSYPMSLRDYNIIKAAPLGYITFQCGSGDTMKGYIENLNYRVAKGSADITLKLKW